MNSKGKKIAAFVGAIILAVGLTVGALALSSMTLPQVLIKGDWKVAGSESDTPVFQFQSGGLVLVNATALASGQLQKLVGASEFPTVSSDFVIAGQYTLSPYCWWNTPDKLGIVFTILSYETSVGFWVQVRTNTLELTPMDGGTTVSFVRV